jgi:hypothetical protein
MSFLAPLFILAVAAIAVPIFVHLIQRERKDIIEFPSLMFIGRIPYQSVERRRIHNWWLLIVRAAAMLLVVLAFARPFLNSSAVRAAVATSGAREVVILLDRSASMGYGDRWARAQTEARRIVGGLSGEDRATLVLFDQALEETVRSTNDRASLEVAIRQAAVSSGATRFAPALRLAQSRLNQSTLPRGEVYLITDFQRSGWERQEGVEFPKNATVTPVSVAEPETANLAVSSIAIDRVQFSGEERATIRAALTNRSSKPVANQPVRLEIDGRPVNTQTISVPANASSSVTFPAVTVAVTGMQAAIRSGTDALPKDNDYYFVLSPSRPVSVLIIASEGAARDANRFLTEALEVSKTPPFRSEVVPAARVAATHFANRSVVVLNNATSLSSAAAAALASFVEQGGGVLMALGANTPVRTDSPLIPGSLGGMVDRPNRGGTLGFVDFSHPVFEPLKNEKQTNFGRIPFWRYRGLVPAATDRTLARFDDGAAALVERRVGSGRVLVFTSTLDREWNEAPSHGGVFVPFVYFLTRYLAQYEEPESWHTVGRMLDISAAVGSIVREGQATLAGGSGGASGVVVSPSGTQARLGQGGAPSVPLTEQGFYSVRLAGSGERRPYAVAVNLDPTESDLSTLPPAEFLASVTGTPTAGARGQSLEQPDLTPADKEKQQSFWWFLLVGGLIALLVEAVLSNRLSRRPGAGLA